MKTTRVELHKHLVFTDVLDGKCIVTVGIGPAREAILLAVDPQDKGVPFGRDEQPGLASFPRSVADHPYPATIIRLNYTLLSSIELPEIEAAFPFIQPLTEDSTLIVSGRCHYRNGNPEHNAVMYDQHGQAVRRMVFGDGIEDVQIGLDQRIWVSYFDEGVYGNFGWPNPPMGADGLLCFDMDGHIAWRFHAPGGFGPIDDCYALNVASNAVWAYYYNSFPIVRITRNGEKQAWENTFAGASTIVVDFPRVLLWGGYRDARERCVVQTIDGDELVSPQHLTLCLPDGESLTGAKIIGRDSVLHAFVGTTWYQFDLRELPIP